MADYYFMASWVPICKLQTVMVKVRNIVSITDFFLSHYGSKEEPFYQNKEQFLKNQFERIKLKTLFCSLTLTTSSPTL